MLSFLKHSNKDLYHLTIKLIGIIIVSTMFVFIRVIYWKSVAYVFLIWNIFLAWLPLYFSLIYTNYKFKTNFFKYIFGLLWLVFYPNAPYMLTDFIHLSCYQFYESQSYGVSFSTKFIIWYDFFLISIFVIIALVLSFISLSIMHEYIKKKYGDALGWSFILVICALSSFAIYLGRFVRVNSWDIVTNPFYLLNIILNSLNFQVLTFTILFTILILIFYLTFFLINEYHW